MRWVTDSGWNSLSGSSLFSVRILLFNSHPSTPVWSYGLIVFSRNVRFPSQSALGIKPGDTLSIKLCFEAVALSARLSRHPLHALLFPGIMFENRYLLIPWLVLHGISIAFGGIAFVMAAGSFNPGIARRKQPFSWPFQTCSQLPPSITRVVLSVYDI